MCIPSTTRCTSLSSLLFILIFIKSHILFLHILLVLHILLFYCFALFFILLHILLLISFFYLYIYIYIYSCVVLLLYNLILTLFFIFYIYIFFFFNSLHCPLSGPDLNYISLLIIPCIIYHVTNKETLTLNLDLVKKFRPHNSTFSSDWLHLNFSIGPIGFLLTELYQLWQQSVNIGSIRNNMLSQLRKKKSTKPCYWPN